MDLYKQIQIAREAKGLTQEELARSVGVSKTAVANWESGENVPRLPKLQAIEAVLGATFNVTGSVTKEFMTGALDEDSHRTVIMMSRLPSNVRQALSVLIHRMSDSFSSAEKLDDRVEVIMKKRRKKDEPSSSVTVNTRQDAKDRRRTG